MAMLQKVPSARSKIRKGYAAFTNGDWDTVRELLSEGVTWHPMHHHGDPDHTPEDIVGREQVVTYLQTLRQTNDVEFRGVAVQGNVAMTLDYTQSNDEVGDHGCADRIEFDADGLIKEVWHCIAGTHDDMTAPPSTPKG
jgi:ketosteroid isomerase-like protein